MRTQSACQEAKNFFIAIPMTALLLIRSVDSVRHRIQTGDLLKKGPLDSTLFNLM